MVYFSLISPQIELSLFPLGQYCAVFNPSRLCSGNYTIYKWKFCTATREVRILNVMTLSSCWQVTSFSSVSLELFLFSLSLPLSRLCFFCELYSSCPLGFLILLTFLFYSREKRENKPLDAIFLFLFSDWELWAAHALCLLTSRDKLKARSVAFVTWFLGRGWWSTFGCFLCWS